MENWRTRSLFPFIFQKGQIDTGVTDARSVLTCEGDLGVAVHALLLSAVFIRFGAAPGPLHVSEVLTPSLSSCVFLQSFLLCSSVLKPDLCRNMA